MFADDEVFSFAAAIGDIMFESALAACDWLEFSL